MKYLLLILVGVTLLASGFLLGLEEPSPESAYTTLVISETPEGLNELIINMDVARQTHQYYLDNWHYWPQDLNQQRNWVDIYERVIKVLERLR